MGVRVSPTSVSQVTPTQALELGVENVLETEMTVNEMLESRVSAEQNIVENITN